MRARCRSHRTIAANARRRRQQPVRQRASRHGKLAVGGRRAVCRAARSAVGRPARAIRAISAPQRRALVAAGQRRRAAASGRRAIASAASRRRLESSSTATLSRAPCDLHLRPIFLQHPFRASRSFVSLFVQPHLKLVKSGDRRRISVFFVLFCFVFLLCLRFCASRALVLYRSISAFLIRLLAHRPFARCFDSPTRLPLLHLPVSSSLSGSCTLAYAPFVRSLARMLNVLYRSPLAPNKSEINDDQSERSSHCYSCENKQ